MTTILRWLGGAALRCVAAGAFGLAAAASAFAAPFPGCGAQTGEINSSRVLTEVTLVATSFSYEYRFCNTSGGGGVIGEVPMTWDIPYDPTAGISAIRAGGLWAFSVETIGVPNPTTRWDGVASWQTAGDPARDAFPAFANHTQVLHWYHCPTPAGHCDFIMPGDSLDGFGYLADVGPARGPYQSVYLLQAERSGDPGFPVGIAFRIAEPGMLALMGLGIAFALRRRRRMCC